MTCDSCPLSLLCFQRDMHYELCLRCGRVSVAESHWYDPVFVVKYCVREHTREGLAIVSNFVCIECSGRAELKVLIENRYDRTESPGIIEFHRKKTETWLTRKR